MRAGVGERMKRIEVGSRREGKERASRCLEWLPKVISDKGRARAFSKMSWRHLRLGCEIVRGRGVHAASTPPDNITLKRAEARAPSAATVLIKPL